MKRFDLTLGSFGAATVAAASLLLSSGCGSEPPASPTPAEELGTLTMPLQTEVNGVRYRLSASFFLEGPESQFLQENGSGTILFAVVAPGEYTVELLDGWSLERGTPETGFVNVEAELVSPNPRPLSMEPGGSVNMAWVFSTDGVEVFGRATYQGNLAVIDSSNPATVLGGGDVLVNDQAQLDAYAGIEQIAGSLDIVGPVTSLAPLAALTTVTGDLSIVRSSLTDLGGLENLDTVGSALVITTNDSLQSLSALGSLSRVSDLFIHRNPALPACEAQRIVDQVAVGQPTGDGGFTPGTTVVFANDGEGSCD